MQALDQITNQTPQAKMNRIIEQLNTLVQTCYDSYAGFSQAAEAVDYPDLVPVFSQYAAQRDAFGTELNTLIISMGYKPIRRGTILAGVHRGWMNIKSALTGGDEVGLLNECLSGEAAAIENYKGVLSTPLPNNLREIVHKQYQAIQEAHHTLETLRNAAQDDA